MLGVLPSGATLQQGTYQLAYPLGQGGFGVTYRARHTEFDDDVAIKEFFPRDFAARDAASPRVSAAATHQDTYQRWLERLIREGRVLRQLRHENVVRVTNLFQENGTAYLVMDLVDGRSLREELDAQPDGRLPEARVAAIAAARRVSRRRRAWCRSTRGSGW